MTAPGPGRAPLTMEAVARVLSVMRGGNPALGHGLGGSWSVTAAALERTFDSLRAALSAAEAERDEANKVADGLGDELNRAEARLARLRPLVRWAFGVWDWLWTDKGMDSEDGWDLAEKARECGLAARVKYDPDVHGETEADPGDEILYPSDMNPADRAWALEGEDAR
jgi:hypothetical protein